MSYCEGKRDHLLVDRFAATAAVGKQVETGFLPKKGPSKSRQAEIVPGRQHWWLGKKGTGIVVSQNGNAGFPHEVRWRTQQWGRSFSPMGEEDLKEGERGVSGRDGSTPFARCPHALAKASSAATGKAGGRAHLQHVPHALPPAGGARAVRSLCHLQGGRGGEYKKTKKKSKEINRFPGNERTGTVDMGIMYGRQEVPSTWGGGGEKRENLPR